MSISNLARQTGREGSQTLPASLIQTDGEKLAIFSNGVGRDASRLTHLKPGQMQSPASPSDVLALQRTVGNRAVSRFLKKTPSSRYPRYAEPLRTSTDITEPAVRPRAAHAVSKTSLLDRVALTSSSPTATLMPAKTNRTGSWHKPLLITRVTPRIQRQAEGNGAKDKKEKLDEDWDFTPADYAALKKKKGELKIASDSSWFPKEFQTNLLNTLNALLDPSREPSATEGINLKDFFHGHIALIKQGSGGLPENLQEKESKFKGREKEIFNQFYYRKNDSSPADLAKSMKDLQLLATELLTEAKKNKGLSIIYHTFERNDPSDLADKPKKFWGGSRARSLAHDDPRRNYITPLETNEPGNYIPPKSWAASWIEDFSPVLSFSFLVDKNGAIHIRPGDERHLSTVTGKGAKP